jgi:DNA-binding MarR family transcriptional regulator
LEDAVFREQLEFRVLLSHCPVVAMPVNRPQPAPPPPASSASGGDGRLYLRDQDLNEGAALIRAAARRIGQLAEIAGAAANISAPEMDILQEIHDLGPMDVGDLRARLAAPKQSLARNLNQLEARSFVKRETDPRDRRRRLVTLTAEGAAFTREATERRRTALRQAFLTAGPDAVSGARRMLSELLRARGES